MGNSLRCISCNDAEILNQNSKHTVSGLKKTRTRHNHSHRQRQQLIQLEQAFAAAVLLHNHQPTSFTRSTSILYRSPSTSKNQRVLNQEVKREEVETSHFVLVHGGGFGAWCWYKTMTLLQDSGFKVDVVDLTGSGVNSFDTNKINTLAQYVHPLTDFLTKQIHDKEKVILVGHDLGGACISFVMELFPSKISKAVFIAAVMFTSGQSTLDLFSQQTMSYDLMRRAQIFTYANGKDNLPTSIDLDRTLLKDFMFNRTSTKDIALASVSMRPIPFAPLQEKLCLTDMKYGSIPRFYVKTLDDFAIPVTAQEAMIKSNPPKEVFEVKGSDHAPFFSRPQALHRILLQVSRI